MSILIGGLRTQMRVNAIFGRAAIGLYRIIRVRAEALHPVIRAAASFILGSLIKLRGFDCPSTEIRFCYRYLLGLHEPGTRLAIEKAIRTGMTVVDVGAHLGYFTVLFARLVGKNGRVFAFEPDPRTFEFLERNTISFENVRRLNAAVLDRETSVTLYRSQRSSHNSLWAENVDLPIGSVSVRTVRLDDVLRDVSPDFVKIDAEGCELEVLDSMREVFTRSPRITLLVELNPSRIKARERTPEDLLQKLLGLGFEISFVNETTSSVEPPANTFAGLTAGLNRHRNSNYINLLCTRPQYE